MVIREVITKFSNITTYTSVIIICSNDIHAAATASSLALRNFGIPLTGSMSAGFTMGFMKG